MSLPLPFGDAFLPFATDRSDWSGRRVVLSRAAPRAIQSYRTGAKAKDREEPGQGVSAIPRPEALRLAACGRSGRRPGMAPTGYLRRAQGGRDVNRVDVAPDEIVQHGKFLLKRPSWFSETTAMVRRTPSGCLSLGARGNR